MAIKIHDEQLKSVCDHAENTYPHECCGLLVGTENNDIKMVKNVVKADNVRNQGTRRKRYLINPEEFVSVERKAHQDGLEVIGFYHSHPDAGARPSEYDLIHAWPWYSYVIVSVSDKGYGQVTSWRLRDDRAKFDKESLIIE